MTGESYRLRRKVCGAHGEQENGEPHLAMASLNLHAEAVRPEDEKRKFIPFFICRCAAGCRLQRDCVRLELAYNLFFIYPQSRRNCSFPDDMMGSRLEAEITVSDCSMTQGLVE
jgi:hypothetical protein